MRRNARGGFTLVEMLAVITLMTLVVGIAVSLLRSLMLADRRAQETAPRRAAVAQLRDAVRGDIRRAADVRTEGGALVVERFDGPVAYELADGLCRRRASDAGQTRTYAVGEVESWLVDDESAAQGSVVTAQLARPEHARGVPIHVAAELGAATPAEREAP